MTIVHLELAPICLQLRAPLRAGGVVYTERRGWQVVVITIDGQRGLGEATPLPAFGTESLSVSEKSLEAAAGALQRRSLPRSLDAITSLLDSIPELARSPAARHGVELALLDRLAQTRGWPLARLLSPQARRRVAISALIDGSGLDAIARSREAVQQGFRTLKLKASGRDRQSFAEELRLLRLELELEPAVALRIDANGCWTEAEAVSTLNKLSPYRIELCEQPLVPGDVEALRRLRGQAPCPIAADESLASAEEREALLDTRAGLAVDAMVLKPMVLGGLLPALSLARRCANAGIDVLVTSSLDGSVARAGAAHLAAAIPQHRLAAGLATGRLLAGEETPHPLPITAGLIELQDCPGLGLERACARISVGTTGHGSVCCPVRQWSKEAPDRVALACADRSWSFQRLDQECGRWVSLFGAAGLRRTERVAVLSHNSPELVALLVAAARMGVAVVPLNARLTSAELLQQLERVSPRLTFAGSELRERLPEARRLDASAQVPADGGAACWASDATLALLFTSGTAGFPKAAELTVGNFLAHAAAATDRLRLVAGDVSLACLPLFHVGGVAMAVRSLLAGGTLLLQRGFEPEAVNVAIDGGAGHVSVVATMLRRLLAVRGERRFPPTLRSMLVGGGPVPSELLARARALGAPVLKTYGLTEACSQVATEFLEEADGHSAGPTLAGVELHVVDEQGGVLPPGQVGEIVVGGPTVMKGYWGDSRSTAAAFRDGFLHTGDIGHLDERGRLTVLARRTDLIISGGENIYPAEVEAVLLQHPAVADVLVYAMPDHEWGQLPAATVAFNGAAVPEAELDRWCRARLAGFKVPRHYRFVTAISRSALGKVDRASAPLTQGGYTLNTAK